MPKPLRLHLIDGTYELFRAHYSKRPERRSPNGVDVKATVGVVQSLLALLRDKDEAPTHLAVAFDNPVRSFRNDIFLGYKTEEGVEPGLLAQFDMVEEAVAALGIAVWSMKEFEADDGLASGAHQFASHVEQVRILTPDKDLGQCLRGQHVVQVDRRQQKVTDETTFIANRGFAPRSIPDFLALTGDTADGIPGLRGFGEKSAAQVLGAYKHLEDIPTDVSQWTVKPRGADKLAATLAGEFDNALLYRRLATLVESVPLPHTFAQLQFAGVPRDAFGAWSQSMGVALDVEGLTALVTNGS